MKRARYMAAGILAIAADAWGVEFDCVLAAGEPFESQGDFAVVNISGPLTQHGALLWDNYDSIRTRVDAALASNKPAVLLRISSPGGEVAGCFELSDDIRRKAAAAGKWLVAYVDGQATSAAYALACASDHIVVPPTGVVGSIGCIQMAVDQTAADRAMGLAFEIFASGPRKADGNPHVTMNDDARVAIQRGVDDMAQTFFELVGRSRKMSPAAVKSLGAAVFVGAKGVSAKLADEVASFAEVIASGAQQVLAQTGAEKETAMTEDEKKARAALKALAEGDDKECAKKAKSALAALDAKAEDGDGDGDKKDDDKKKDDSDANADDDSGDKKDDDKKDDTKSESSAAAAAVAANPVLAIAARVQTLEANAKKKEEDEERSTLMAQRPDFAPEVVALLSRSPLATVRDAVKTLPRGVAKGQVGAARAAIATTGTQGGAKPPGNSENVQSSVDEEVDRVLGLRKKSVEAGFRPVENGLRVLNTMTPSEARERAGKAAGK